MNDDLLKIFFQNIGHQFDHTERLQAALTHSSSGAAHNYERLEFLGDRVLGLVMAHILYDAFPQESEGDLAKRHAALVQGTTLAQMARRIGLGDLIVLSDAERAAGGAENDNILADSLEAVIGALYMDAGLDACHRVIRDVWSDDIHVLTEPPQDPKTALQEWAQARGLPLPSYNVVGKEGPDHAPLFDICVSVDGFDPVTARGSSRRAAEKDAAAVLLSQLEKESS